jgi:hypothetical protein
MTVCLVAGGVLFILLELEIVQGPGPPPGIPNDYPTRLGYYFADQRAIFGYEIAAGLLFSLGFLALGGVGLGLRGLTPQRDPAGTLVATCFGISGGLLIVSQLMYLGAKRVAIDPAICECKYAPEQLISQDRTLDMVMGMQDWLVAGSLLLAGLGMLAIPSVAARSRILSATWARASQILAVLFFIGVVGFVFEIDVLSQLIAAVGSVILLPAWAMWLDRQLGSRRALPEATRPGGQDVPERTRG